MRLLFIGGGRRKRARAEGERVNPSVQGDANFSTAGRGDANAARFRRAARHEAV